MGDELTKRIREVILFKNLSPSQLADTIGINRSRVSHILTGRNNPSLEIVQGLLDSYPDINPDWLLFGQGAKLRTGEPTKMEAITLGEPDEDQNSDLLSYMRKEELKKMHSNAVQIEKKDPQVAENYEVKAEKTPIQKEPEKIDINENLIPKNRVGIKMITLLYENGEYEILYPQK